MKNGHVETSKEKLYVDTEALKANKYRAKIIAASFMLRPSTTPCVKKGLVTCESLFIQPSHYPFSGNYIVLF